MQRLESACNFAFVFAAGSDDQFLHILQVILAILKMSSSKKKRRDATKSSSISTLEAEAISASYPETLLSSSISAKGADGKEPVVIKRPDGGWGWVSDLFPPPIIESLII